MAKVKMIALVDREVLDDLGKVVEAESLTAGETYVYDTTKPEQVATMERWERRGVICKPEEYEAQLQAQQADEDRAAAVQTAREAAAGNAAALTKQVETLQRELEATSDEVSRLQTEVAAANEARNQALDDVAARAAELEDAKTKIATLEAAKAGGKE